MAICCVYGCNTDSRNSKKTGSHLFHFPKNKKLSKQWLHLCRRKDKVNVKNAYICSVHFYDSDYKNLLQHQMVGTKLFLNPDAVPSKNLPFMKCTDESKLVRNVARLDRVTKRKKIDESVQISTTYTETNDKDCTAMKNNEFQDLQVCSVPVQDREKELENETQQLKKENEKQHKQLQELENKNQLLRKENEQQHKQLQELENKNQQLQNQNEQLNQQLQVFKGIFTPVQISRLLKPKKLTQWKREDIAAAMTLKSMSTTCYKYLREVKKIPLPSESTLEYWLKKSENCITAVNVIK